MLVRACMRACVCVCVWVYMCTLSLTTIPIRERLSSSLDGKVRGGEGAVVLMEIDIYRLF